LLYPQISDMTIRVLSAFSHLLLCVTHALVPREVLSSKFTCLAKGSEKYCALIPANRDEGAASQLLASASKALYAL